MGYLFFYYLPLYSNLWFFERGKYNGCFYNWIMDHHAHLVYWLHNQRQKENNYVSKTIGRHDEKYWQ